MPLVLSNDDVTRLLSMSDCIGALRGTFVDLGQGAAVTGPRVDHVVAGPVDGSIYNLKSMCGIVPGSDMAALRLNSEIKIYPERAQGDRQEKLPLASGGNFVGLVLLFKVSTGELQAIFPDGVLQQMRVAATSALGAEALARQDAGTVALIGSGWQARGHAAAFCAVRPIEEIRAYSPNPEHRNEFARSLSEELKVDVVAVDSGAEACAGAAIVAAVTNSQVPLLRPEWIEPGMHLTCVRMLELGREILEGCDVVGMNWSWQRRVETDMYTFEAAGSPEGWVQDFKGQRSTVDEWGLNTREMPDLAQLMTGQTAGRSDDGQITAFPNKGWGVQFAAPGARILELAREQGIGHELPAEWFVQDVHP